MNRATKTILSQEDTDRNYQVTIEDTGPKALRLGTLHSGGYLKRPIHGTYMISSLLQELVFQSDASQGSAAFSGHMVISEAKLRENPVQRLLGMIEGRFWPALIRRIDAGSLARVLVDDKNRTEDQSLRLYVPCDDLVAQEYYQQVAIDRPELKLVVSILPKDLTPHFAASIRNHPGLLCLALTRDTEGRIEGLPFAVPGGRFNEMYGWDSYFCALGLLQQPDPTGYYLYIAKSMVDNMVYEIEHYGKILNANRSYYLTRSQPPFLTAMARKVLDKLALLDKSASHASGLYHERLYAEPGAVWYERVMTAAIKEYLCVWTTEPRLVAHHGLSRYYDEGIGIPIETEASHYEAVLSEFAVKWSMSLTDFIAAYNSGAVKEPNLDAYFVHDRAMRESGHDTTYRFDGRTVDLLTVDLNALLYRYETDIAEFLETLPEDRIMVSGEIQRASWWRVQAAARQERMRRLMWNAERGLWFDYDFVQGAQSEYETITSFWTLWAGLASPDEAQLMVERGLPLFEEAGGLVAGTERSRGPISLTRPNRQWDYPYGWAPHQMMAWEGLLRYGYARKAQRLAYRWLYMIAKCFAEYNAVVPEKFDVLARSHKVTAEYGNVGTDFRLAPREGFGWMNASFQLGLSLLSRPERRALEILVPPERLFTD